MSFRILMVLGASVASFSLMTAPALSQKSSVKSTTSKAGQTILVGSARVLDGDTLEIQGQKIRLHGIDAPENAQKCAPQARQDEHKWRCGRTAKRRMIEMTQGQDVSCKLRKKDGFGRWIAECFVSDVNLNRQMVLQGMAWAFRKYSMDFIGEEQQAKRKGVGIWSANNEPAWTYRAKKWMVSTKDEVAPNGCVIKGNISRRNKKKQKIYHLPWFKSYKRTRINRKKGERWFCSEQEAVQAGWRRAYNVSR